jgi:hypothetical protein
MLNDVIEELGIDCPKGGEFYAIADKASGFLGCCSLDLLGSATGDCPLEWVTPTTFDEDAYDKIPPQSCGGNDPDALWYTCALSDPPFMGCCAQNPCSIGECPEEALRPGRVSGDKKNATVFIGPWTITTAITPSVTPTSSSSTFSTIPTSSTFTTQAASSTPTSSVTSSGNGTPIGAIAGGVIGGIAALAGIGTLIFWIMKRTRKQKSEASPAPEQTCHHYHGACDNTYVGRAEPDAYSPSMAMSSPRSYYKPQYSYQSENVNPVLAELPGSPAVSSPASPPRSSPSSFGDAFTARHPTYTPAEHTVNELDDQGNRF